ncbi:MAG: hypothetical protein Q8K60_09595 [Parachlamydiaceae bacterium]|nr:hypothetical protein [Parachlamydiaceae bacterium]
MKSIKFLLLFLLPLSLIYADYQPLPRCCTKTPYCESTQPLFLENIPNYFIPCWTLDVRFAYFSPSSKKIRDVYSSAWFDFQVETSKRIFKYVDFFAGVSWAVKHSHKEPIRYGFKDKTRMFLLPFSAGLRWMYPILPCTEIYLGAGVCYTFLQIRNRFREDCSDFQYYYADRYYSSAPFQHNTKKSALGGVFKVGVHYTLGSYTFLDIFADYYLQRFDISKNGKKRSIFTGHVNCSGFKFGAGLGVFF